MRWTKQILNSPLAKNTLKLSSSNVVMYLLPIIVTPVLSRLYSTEDYGEWGLFSSAYLIVNAVLFLSYENTLVKTKDERELPALSLMCLLVAWCVIALTAVVFLAGRRLQVSFFENFPSLPLLIVLLFTTSFSQLFYNLSNRYEKYSLMAVANVVQGGTQAALRLALSLVKSFNGLIVGNMLAQFATLVVYVSGLRRQLSQLLSQRPRLGDLGRLMVKYKNFPLFDAPGMILEASIGNLALIILSLYFPKSIIGCYSIIFQFMVLPISLIGSAMSKVYYKEISVAKDVSEISGVTRRVTKISFLLAMIPITFVVLGGDIFITWYLGDKWAVAGNFALCMSMMSVPIVLTESLLPLYRVIDRQRTRFLFDLVCVLLGLGGLVVACNSMTNVYGVLMVYVVLYSMVRFLLFFNIKKHASVRFLPKEWALAVGAILLCYTVLFVRLCHLLVL